MLMKWTQPSSHTSLTRGAMGVVVRVTHTHYQDKGRKGAMHITI